MSRLDTRKRGRRTSPSHTPEAKAAYWKKWAELPGNREKAKNYQKKYARIHSEELKEKAKNRRLKRLYNITREQYDKMNEAQNGRCKLCANDPAPGKSLAVDHCHETGKVRGLLCRMCNRNIIGLIESQGIDPQKIVEHLA